MSPGAQADDDAQEGTVIAAVLGDTVLGGAIVEECPRGLYVEAAGSMERSGGGAGVSCCYRYPLSGSQGHLLPIYFFL
jgi:hypothetical protein